MTTETNQQERSAGADIGGTSPVEHVRAPEHLDAHVVDAAAAPRIHGYAVDDDLAVHYSFAEVVLLSLTGEAPDEATGRAFEVALTFMTPVSIAEAPANAARVARIIGANEAGVVGVAAAMLSEQARWMLDEHAAVLAWLDGQQQAFPTEARARGDDERDRVDRLRATLDESFAQRAVFAQDPALWPALLGVLHACGLTEREHIAAAMVQARMATAVAEAVAVERGAVTHYPINLPPFRYDP